MSIVGCVGIDGAAWVHDCLALGLYDNRRVDVMVGSELDSDWWVKYSRRFRSVGDRRWLDL